MKNPNQLKIKIYILKSIDVVLVIALIITALYAAFYSENRESLLMACLVGLFIVSMLGRVINNKVSLMKVELSMLLRELKTEEQRTLMSTRHTRSGTNPGTKKPSK